MDILVVGGAGYIGSHMVHLLHAAGYRVIVLDDLSKGYRDAVRGGRLVVGSVGNRPLLDRLFAAHRFVAVMDFASLIEVGQSVRDPAAFYNNNLGQTLVLLDAMRRHRVRNLVFSSTAAIFGEPQQACIDEDHPQRPINPYGRSKWLVEQLLADYQAAYGLETVCLRYFNAAGALPDAGLGERHEPETHLIPLVLQVANGRRRSLQLFGTDYPTPDGTCIRDYVHVVDLCAAHLLALERLLDRGGSARYNLGSGLGYSVREVLHLACRITGRPLRYDEQPRRPGDPVRLVANPARAMVELGWRPQHADLDRIISDAWAWEQQLAQRLARAVA